jgi:hypothetical protein
MTPRCCACVEKIWERWQSRLRVDNLARLERHQKANEWSTIGDTDDSSTAGLSLAAASETSFDLGDWEDVRDAAGLERTFDAPVDRGPIPVSKA